jgi:hypothetical protein
MLLVVAIWGGAECEKEGHFFAAALVVVHQETAFAAATVYLNF